MEKSFQLGLLVSPPSISFTIVDIVKSRGQGLKWLVKIELEQFNLPSEYSGLISYDQLCL